MVIGDKRCCSPCDRREFKRRREALVSLALERLSPGDHARFGLRRDTILDGNAPEVYDALTRITDIPISLDCCSMASAYDLYFWQAPDSPNSILPLLGMLYDAGFTAIDLPNASGQTP